MSHYIWQLASWPVFSWSAQEIVAPLGKARFLQGRLLGQVHALGFAATDEVRQRFLVTEAVQTSAIEGVQLDQDAVRSSVARRLGLPTAGLSPATPQTESLVDLLFDATNRYEEPLSPDRLKRWQVALFPTGHSGLKKIMVGDWRKKPLQVVSGPIGKEREHFAAPQPERLATEMDCFFSWFGTSSRQVDGLLRAGLAHLYFVTIHPFEDGNGRIARAITDMALAQDEKLANRFTAYPARSCTKGMITTQFLRKPRKAMGMSPNGSAGISAAFSVLSNVRKIFLRMLPSSRASGSGLATFHYQNTSARWLTGCLMPDQEVLWGGADNTKVRRSCSCKPRHRIPRDCRFTQ
jgi:hypothetical protein